MGRNTSEKNNCLLILMRKKTFLLGIMFISFVQLFACGSLSHNFADEFTRRERQFLSCPGAQLKTAEPKKIHCPTNYPGMCYYSCLKCASTSLLFTFQPERRVTLRDCDFNDIHSLILFKRDIMGRFMSAYGQITYQEYKRGFKKKEAIRNGYGKIRPVDNPEERFSLFLSAYENEKQRRTIPDFYHADSIFSMYKNLHYCLIRAEQRPKVYIIKVEDIDNELQALGQCECFLPSFTFRI
jgi:hypothetical protein